MFSRNFLDTLYGRSALQETESPHHIALASPFDIESCVVVEATCLLTNELKPVRAVRGTRVAEEDLQHSSNNNNNNSSSNNTGQLIQEEVRQIGAAKWSGYALHRARIGVSRE
jgi:hypothetical protein